MNERDEAELEQWRNFADKIEPFSPVRLKNIRDRVFLGERYIVIISSMDGD